MTSAPPLWARHREYLQRLLETSLDLADPGPLVRAHLRLAGEFLQVGRRSFPRTSQSRVIVLSLGKAASAMAQAASSALGSALHQGLLVAPQVPPRLPPRFRAIQGGHPLPDEGSLEAGQAAAELVRGMSSSDIFLALVSGGGSACMEIPAPGIDLQTLRAVTRRLILSGARIEEINLVRSALSDLKRGRLARRALPAQTIGMILSDVTGDRLEMVASGPTVEAPLPAAEVRQVVRQCQVEELLPAKALETLESTSVPPAMRPEPYNLLLGSNAWLAESVARAAATMGFEARVVTTEMTGEARTVGESIASRLCQIRSASFQNPLALIFGGETTVTVHGAGQGGRNQELALSAALRLEGVEKVALMAFATDGIDGNSGAAGALATGDTCQRAGRLGYSPREALEQNDSHSLFHRLGDCLHTGPSGTNLNDLVIALLFV